MNRLTDAKYMWLFAGAFILLALREAWDSGSITAYIPVISGSIIISLAFTIYCLVRK